MSPKGALCQLGGRRRRPQEAADLRQRFRARGADTIILKRNCCLAICRAQLNYNVSSLSGCEAVTNPLKLGTVCGEDRIESGAPRAPAASPAIYEELDGK